jgi:hypothetical protein
VQTSLLLASLGYEDGGPDVLQLGAAEILGVAPGCRYGKVPTAGGLEVVFWGRIRSAFGGLDCSVLSRLKLGGFGWLRSFEIVVAAVSECEAVADF